MPAFVLVHGACHGAWCWERIVPLLARDPNVSRVLAVDLPGHGARREAQPIEAITRADYVDAVVRDIEAADLDRIVLVGHSLAGITIPSVAARLPDRILRLVYLSTTNPAVGQSVMDELTAHPLSPISRGIDLEASFCSDLDADASAWLRSRLCPEPPGPMLEKATRVAGPTGIASTYVLLEEDETLPPIYQLDQASRIGVDEIVRLRSGHSAFASQPEALARILLAGSPSP